MAPGRRPDRHGQELDRTASTCPRFRRRDDTCRRRDHLGRSLHRTDPRGVCPARGSGDIERWCHRLAGVVPRPCNGPAPARRGVRAGVIEAADVEGSAGGARCLATAGRANQTVGHEEGGQHDDGDRHPELEACSPGYGPESPRPRQGGCLHGEILRGGSHLRSLDRVQNGCGTAHWARLRVRGAGWTPTWAGDRRTVGFRRRSTWPGGGGR